jgi:cytoskeletal protein CcmA (bactofilin family)
MTMFTRNDNNPTGKPAADTPPAAAPAAAAEVRVAAPRPAAPPSSSPSMSVISKALKITGQLESTEDIQIEGEVEGDVRAANVKVGANARVKGTVYGDTVEIAGTVDGKIEARKVVLNSTARMSGDVVHQDIKIDSGAYIDGHCKPEFGKSGAKNVQPLHKASVAVTPAPASGSAS